MKITYMLFFRHGQNPAPQFFCVEFPADWPITRIVQRCKDHCTVMNYRFVLVRPLLVDLAQAERTQNGESVTSPLPPSAPIAQPGLVGGTLAVK